MKKSRLSDWDIKKAANFGGKHDGSIDSHGIEQIGKHHVHQHGKSKHNKGLCLLCGDIHY